MLDLLAFGFIVVLFIVCWSFPSLSLSLTYFFASILFGDKRFGAVEGCAEQIKSWGDSKTQH